MKLFYNIKWLSEVERVVKGVVTVSEFLVLNYMSLQVVYNFKDGTKVVKRVESDCG